MKTKIICTCLAIAFFSSLSFAQSSMSLTPAQALAKKEESSTAHVELAASYYLAGKMDVAMEELQKLLANDPKDSQAHDLMGLIYFRSDNMAEAESHFKISIASDPNNGSANSNYGMLLCKSGRYDAGMEAFGKSLISPKLSRVSQTLLNGGICLQQKGDLPGAEKFLIKALEQEPFMPAALYQLARVYTATNRLDQAESRISALHKQVAPNSASTYLLYQVNRAQGKAKQADGLAQTLKARFPDSAETQQLLPN